MIYVLLILIGLIGLVLLAPIGLEVDYSGDRKRWAIVWLGLRFPIRVSFRKAIRLMQDEASPPAEPEPTKHEETETESAGFPSLDSIIELMRTGVQAFHRGIDVLRSFHRHTKVIVHQFDVVTATPNPALTGFAYGMAYAFGSAFAPSVPWTVAADFTATRPSLHFRVEVRIVPIRVLPSLLRMGWLVTKRIAMQRWQTRRTTPL